MRSAFLQLAFLTIAIATICSAQDSKFPPAEQQIPVPECLTMEGCGKAARRHAHKMSMKPGWLTSHTGATSAASESATTDPATIFPRCNGRSPVSFSLR